MLNSFGISDMSIFFILKIIKQCNLACIYYCIVTTECKTQGVINKKRQKFQLVLKIMLMRRRNQHQACDNAARGSFIPDLLSRLVAMDGRGIKFGDTP